MRYLCIVLSCVLLIQQPAYSDEGLLRNGSNSSQPGKVIKEVDTDIEQKNVAKKANNIVPLTHPKLGDAGASTQLTDTSQFMPSTAKIITIVGLIIFMASVALYLKFKKNPRFNFKSQGDRQLKLLSDLSVGSGTLSLVSLGDKIYLIGSNDHAMTCLDQIVDPVEKDKIIYSTEQEESPAGFRTEYNDMLQQMNQGMATEMEPQALSVELDNLKDRLKELA